MLPRRDRWQFRLRGGSAEEGGAPLAGRPQVAPSLGEPLQARIMVTLMTCLDHTGDTCPCLRTQ